MKKNNILMMAACCSLYMGSVSMVLAQVDPEQESTASRSSPNPTVTVPDDTKLLNDHDQINSAVPEEVKASDGCNEKTGKLKDGTPVLKKDCKKGNTSTVTPVAPAKR